MKKILKEFGSITIGVAAAVAGLNLFLVPEKIAAGGVSGIATIFYHLLDVPLGISIAVLNVPLFFFGFKALGKSFVFKTLYAVALFTALSEIVPIPQNSGDLFISTIYGGVLVGIGMGIVIRVGGTTGGSDMAAKLLAERFHNVSLATVLFAVDFFIIAASGFLFNATVALYAIVSLYISTKVLDFFAVGLSVAKAFYIISEHNHKIADAIMHQMQRGCTSFFAKGRYSNRDKEVLLCVLKWRTEGARLKKLVKEIDPEAFVIVADVKEVLGEGFTP